MLKVGMLAALGAGLLGMLMAWKMRDVIDILQLGFTINSAALFLPTVAAIYWNRVSASAAFWSSSLSLATVIGWRLAADAGAGGVFAIDPLWPGLLVSLAVLVAMQVALGPKRVAEASA
jgi:SSS family solute:Na+ symporter